MGPKEGKKLMCIALMTMMPKVLLYRFECQWLAHGGEFALPCHQWDLEGSALQLAVQHRLWSVCCSWQSIQRQLSSTRMRFSLLKMGGGGRGPAISFHVFRWWRKMATPTCKSTWEIHSSDKVFKPSKMDRRRWVMGTRGQFRTQPVITS